MRYRDIIRHRSVWMGVAIIWVVFFHIPEYSSQPLIAFVKKLGYGGVDLCLFASGVGCFYSLSRDPDMGRFIVRRFWRLAPVYLLFMAFWIPWKWFEGALTIPNVIGNLFGIQYLTALDLEFNWYVSAIIVFYFLAPYLKAFLDTASRRGKILMLLVLLALVIPFWKSGVYIIIVTRLPVFYLGMLFASGAEEDRVVRPWQMAVGFVLMMLGIYFLKLAFEHIPDTLWRYGVAWVPFVAIAPPMCLFLSMCMSALERIPGGKAVIGTLSWVGSYSFEIYLLHISMVELLPELIRTQELEQRSGLVWCAGICVMMVLCLLMRGVSEALVRLVRRK
ncbi:MAG: acyltransferase [Oscillospiraceae bacterium]|nr:acyltransferase [Oscillospiraceae bacterium]